MNLKKIASARAASLLDRDESVIIQRRKKDNTGVLIYNKSPRSAHDRHHGAQSYCVLFKNEGMPEHKYASHGSEDCTDVCTKRSIKYGMGGPIESRTHDLQQHKKSENKCNKEMKSLNKKNKMLYSISKKSGLRREIKKIKNIKAEASKKTSVYYSDD